METNEMKVWIEEIAFQTKIHTDIVDMTHDIESKVHSSGIEQGICLIYLPHSTAALFVNENENGLLHDILKKNWGNVPR